MTRVFVTGMGAITPIGNNVGAFWQNLINGQSGADTITLFDPGSMPYNIACEVKNFIPSDYMDEMLVQQTARATQFAIAASRQALRDANLTIHAQNRTDIGVLIATGGGGITEVEHATLDMLRKSWQTVDPLFMPRVMPNAVSSMVSIDTGARGPVMTYTAACAGGHYSILEGFYFLQRGEAKAMIVGGTEALNSPLILAAFGRMGPLSGRTDDPKHAGRPFSVDRDGFVAGEGAAALILETEEHARARGATIYAEILGGALTGDAYHVTAPEPSGFGATRSLERAIKNAGLQTSDIDVIFAHGTGTQLNDEVESKAIHHVFDPDTARLKITSIKGTIGHTLGAAGGHSAIAAVCCLNHGIVPPTVNYTPDPALALPIVATVESTLARYALVNAFGFGGQNVVVVISKAKI
jgi:3-oxoacyl-[acyl-carrier-protein] synthase II